MARKENYYSTADIVRIVCIVLLILAAYGLPASNITSLICIAFNAAVGVLFTIYGYFTIREGRDFTGSLKRTLKTFLIMFVIYFLLTCVYMLFVYGTPFGWLTKREIFEIVVLNYWGPSFGCTIWMIQSQLYALIAFKIMDKLGLMKFDMIFCVIFFVIAILLGEGAGIIQLNVLGYSVIPGNFLTRAMPYMLLGRIIYRNRAKIRSLPTVLLAILLIVGLGLGIGEFFLLSFLGVLRYYNHAIGYILTAFAAMALILKKPSLGRKNFLVGLNEKMIFPMYAIFNPIAEIMIIVILLVAQTEEVYNQLMSGVGIVTALLAFGASVVIALVGSWLQYNSSVKSKKQS